MGRITTLDNLNNPSELAPNQVNFPALQHYFPMTELSGNTITDTINNVAIKTGDITGDGTKLKTSGSGVQGVDRAWQQPGAKHIVCMVFGDSIYNGLGFEVGDCGSAASDIGFGTDVVDNGFSIGDGANIATDLPGAAGNFSRGDMMVYQHNTSLASSYCAKSTLARQDNGATATAAMDLTSATIPTDGQFQATSSIHAIFVFYFTTLPSDTAAAHEWMTNEILNNGNKVIWPGWRGRN